MRGKLDRLTPHIVLSEELQAGNKAPPLSVYLGEQREEAENIWRWIRRLALEASIHESLDKAQFILQHLEDLSTPLRSWNRIRWAQIHFLGLSAMKQEATQGIRTRAVVQSG
jgi:hypothetical protein